MTATEPELLNARQAAAMLGISYWTLRRWLELKILPAEAELRPGGATWPKYRASVLRKWIEKKSKRGA